MNRNYEFAKQIEDEIISIRRHLHKNPELSGEELESSKLVAEFLRELGIKVQTNVGGYGVVGILEGKFPGKTLAIRADMDALPIHEDTGLSFTSDVEGKMHACGHDIHTSVLLGAAKLLNNHKDQLHGRVKFIFQPAEEKMDGALSMMEAGVLEDPKVDAIMCLHCWPEVEAGKIGVRRGPIMAASDHFEVTIYGDGGHAAHPHRSIDPITIAGHTITALQTIVSREVAPVEPAVVTIGQIHGGASSNVIAPSVTFSGTVRTVNKETQKAMPDMIKRIVEKTAESMRGRGDVHYTIGAPPVLNDDHLVDVVEEAVREGLGDEHLVYLQHSSLGGEDFAFYLNNVPGILFRLGTSNDNPDTQRMLHHPKLIFDEKALVAGITTFSEAALRYLNSAPNVSAETNLLQEEKIQ